nr:hypothetical protein [Tanacetum cinerariifolium]
PIKPSSKTRRSFWVVRFVGRGWFREKGMELHLRNLTKTLIKPAESKPRASSLSKPAHKPAKNEFSKSKVKKWAIDDINKTISWLDSVRNKK